MSVELSCKEMNKLLAVPRGRRDMRWAHDVCTISRFIHINVWRFCPQRDYVRDTVIPLLKKAKRELLGLSNTKRVDKEKIEQYVANDEKRINNLEKNYLHGKPSAFIPNHKLSGEPPAEAV